MIPDPQFGLMGASGMPSGANTPFAYQPIPDSTTQPGALLPGPGDQIIVQNPFVPDPMPGTGDPLPVVVDPITGLPVDGGVFPPGTGPIFQPFPVIDIEALTRPTNVRPQGYYDEIRARMELENAQRFLGENAQRYYDYRSKTGAKPQLENPIRFTPLGGPVNQNKINQCLQLAQSVMTQSRITAADAQQVAQVYNSLNLEEKASLGPMMNTLQALAERVEALNNQGIPYNMEIALSPEP